MLCPGGSDDLRSSRCPHARSLFAQGLPAGVTGCGAAGTCSIWRSPPPPPMQLRPPLTRGRAGRRRLASARVTLQGHGGNLMESAARRHPCPRAVVRSGDTQAQAHPPANRRCGPKQAQLAGGLEARVSATLVQTGRMRLVLALIIKMGKK